MNKNSITVVIAAIVLAFCFQNISAQITITIPKLPKFKKEKPKTETPTVENNQKTTTSENQTTANTQTTVDTPTAAKTEEPPQSVQQDECKEQGVMYSFLDDVRKQLEDIESFTPARGWFVRDMNYSPLYYAVSPREREKRYGASEGLQKMIKCQNLLAAYEKLGAAAAKKLPQFVPNKTEYPATTPANVALIKGRITNINDYKIFYIGVKEANWLIDKNDFGIPTARYKHGLVWVRNTLDDHPYCRIFYINLVQPYAGGGTYGATYSNYVAKDLAGCPAAK